MKKDDLIKQLNIELDTLPIPNVLEEVKQRSRIQTKAPNASPTVAASKRPLIFRLVPGIMAFTMLFLVLIGSLLPLLNVTDAYTTLSIDLNPSVQLTLDKTDTVTAISAINIDGTILLQQSLVLGRKFNVALQNLLNRAVQLGYLNANAENAFQNAVMFSVTGNNPSMAHRQRNAAQQALDNYLEQNNIAANIIFEQYTQAAKEELEQVRQQFSNTGTMSVAKYQYIKRVIGQFPALENREEYLATLTVAQLYQLLNSSDLGLNMEGLIDQILNNSTPRPGGNNNNSQIGGLFP